MIWRKIQKNNINKDLFYEEQKREKIKAAREEVIRKKKEQAAAKKLENLSEDPIAEGEEEEKEVEPEPEPEEPENVEVIEESVGDSKKELDEDLKKSLDDVDPWMANKLKSQ